MIPGEYKISVEKENYHPWNKNLKVEEKTVTKAENIYLFPEKNTFNLFKDDINDFFLSENKQNIIYLTNNQELIYNNNTILSSVNFKKYLSKIEDVQFFPNLENILIQGKSLQNKTIYYSLNLNTLNLANLKFLETASNFYLANESVIYQSNGTINKYVLSNKRTSIIRDEVDVFTAKDNTIYSVEKKMLIKIEGNRETNLSEKQITLDNYKLEIISGRLFAFDNSNLYLFNENKKDFEFFLKTKNLNYDILPDKIIFNTGTELWLLLLKDFETPFFKNSGSLIFLSRFSSEIKNVTWFNDDYFLYTINNNVYVSEIDNRDNINVFKLSDLSAQKIWFNKNILYLLSENKIYNSSEFD